MKIIEPTFLTDIVAINIDKEWPYFYRENQGKMRYELAPLTDSWEQRLREIEEKE